MKTAILTAIASTVLSVVASTSLAQLANSEATTQAAATRPELVKPTLRIQADVPPDAPREFRAAWVATVQNIDWPTKRGLSTIEQQKEAIAILDRLVELNMNTAILQIRTTCDAFYKSDLEPWSIYLTGEQGKAPEPIYDPLEFWIAESHKRGIELHAWFNPYRAKHAQAKDSQLHASHIANTNPDVVKQYGDFLWMDPGEPFAAQRSYDVFMDVVRRYDVDGIHIDDYFYPYPVRNPNHVGDVDFPDDASWAKHLKETGKSPMPTRPSTGPATMPASQDRADWRRDNVNQLVERIYKGKQEIKPWVKFGISPFGIGRPGKAPGITGFDQYDKLYADAELWLQKGWADYWTPQLYWPIAQKAQSFPVLLDFWISMNTAPNVHFWPGVYTGRLIEEGARQFHPQEPIDQINITRSRGEKSNGQVHFSMKVLMDEKNEGVKLMREYGYYAPALVPASPWLGDKVPVQPRANLTTTDAGVTLRVESAGGEAVRWWAVWDKTDAGWAFSVKPGMESEFVYPKGTTSFVVSAVSRTGVESGRVTVK
jgi:uncharacterized lipoprotein YddW (UPF0748 family)